MDASPAGRKDAPRQLEVEYLHDPVYPGVACDWKTPLDSEVNTVNRPSDEGVAGHDRAIRTQARRSAAAAAVAQVATIAVAVAAAGAVEIDPAELEAVACLPDAVEDRAVALVGGREGLFGADVRREREGDWVPAHESIY